MLRKLSLTKDIEMLPYILAKITSWVGSLKDWCSNNEDGERACQEETEKAETYSKCSEILSGLLFWERSTYMYII